MTEPEPAAPSSARSTTWARWVAGVLLIFYGFAKLNGAQFIVTDSELARPLGEVSGFWLTWHYFGWSPIYKWIIAGTEIAGGLLLLWPRTALVGALMLLPVTINIVIVDILYGVNLDATIVAVVILWCIQEVLWQHIPRLREAVLGAPTAAERIPRARRIATIVAVFLFAFGVNWWMRNRTIRHPTPIDGIWRVSADSDSTGARPHWRQAFFELNRAYQLVLRAPDVPDAVHHFEVDSTGTVRVWATWLSKGEQIGEGHLLPTGEIDLDLTAAAGGGHLRLERAPLRQPGG